MYTDLFAEIVSAVDGTGEVWYLGIANREQRYSDRVVLRMFKGEPKALRPPDLIWYRAKYPGYQSIRKSYPHARTLYYGAGAKKIVPDARYDLVLVDTEAQVRKVKKRYPNLRVLCWAKPAARVFEEWREARVPRYDFALCSATDGQWKGFDWAVANIPRGSSVLRIGPHDQCFWTARKIGALEVDFTGSVAQQRVPLFLAQCRVGLVCDTDRASGPRVIPEFLSLGVPVLLRDTVVCNRDYIGPCGASVVKNDLGACFYRALNVKGVREFYRQNFSLVNVAQSILKEIL